MSPYSLLSIYLSARSTLFQLFKNRFVASVKNDKKFRKQRCALFFNALLFQIIVKMKQYSCNMFILFISSDIALQEIP
jgi:hypothetical protein